jgi:hypothetical protein
MNFNNAPSLPLEDGDYTVEWAIERGIGKELLARMTFTIQGGKVTDYSDA